MPTARRARQAMGWQASSRSVAMAFSVRATYYLIGAELDEPLQQRLGFFRRGECYAAFQEIGQDLAIVREGCEAVRLDEPIEEQLALGLLGRQEFLVAGCAAIRFAFPLVHGSLRIPPSLWQGLPTIVCAEASKGGVGDFLQPSCADGGARLVSIPIARSSCLRRNDRRSPPASIRR